MGVVIDRVGKRYGKLTVLKRLPYNSVAKQAVWWCRCDCGNELAVRASNLHCGQTKSCGCLHKEIITKRPYEHLYNRLVRSAKRRKKQCKLTYVEFLEFTSVKNCFYCGDAIVWDTHASHRGNHQTYKIDRVDNRLGYTKANCRVACSSCNMMKSKLSASDFIFRCKHVAKHNL